MSVAVVWIDQKEAKLFHLSEERMQRECLRNRSTAELMAEITRMVDQVDRILVLGPSSGPGGDAKQDLVKHLKSGGERISRRIAGCETVEEPSDTEIANRALKLFTRS
jgi:hypothetical protein